MNFVMRSFIFLSCLTLSLCSCSKKKEVPKKQPINVEVAKSETATIPIFIEGIGHIKAYNHAKIKARVEGTLFDVLYEQGQVVEEGMPLMNIDPRPYEAKLIQAEGELEKYKADLTFAQDKVIRYSKLIDDNYVSQLHFDEYVANLEALQGSVKKTEGEILEAKLNIEYCKVRAPFTGRVGKRLVDKGNLVTNDGSTLLILNQIQPIFADFSVPEKDLLKIQKKQNKEPLKVKIKIEDVEDFDEIGKLIVIDNDINMQTGMIPLRALFENKKCLLWHGQFIKARLILEEKENAVLIPSRAVNLGQKGDYVYVVDKGNKVKKVDVVIGERLGDLVEVVSGLEAKEMVVTKGQISLKTGAEVNIKKVEKNILNALGKF